MRDISNTDAKIRHECVKHSHQKRLNSCNTSPSDIQLQPAAETAAFFSDNGLMSEQKPGSKKDPRANACEIGGPPHHATVGFLRSSDATGARSNKYPETAVQNRL